MGSNQPLQMWRWYSGLTVRSVYNIHADSANQGFKLQVRFLLSVMVISSAYSALIDLLRYVAAVLLLSFCSRALYDITSSQLNSFHPSHQCYCEELPPNEIT